MKMSESNNPAEDEVLLNCDGNPQNELRNSSLTQETFVGNGCSGRGQLYDGDFWSKFTKKDFIIAILVVWFIVSVGVIIFLDVKQRQSSSGTSCPQDWVRNEEQCYLLSSVEMNWTFCKSYCSSHSGSLVTADTQEERAFVERKWDLADYWINLQKEKEDQPWKWPNGSLVDSWFPIGGRGLCAYLNDNVVSSTNCDNSRYCICKKSLLAT